MFDSGVFAPPPEPKGSLSVRANGRYYQSNPISDTSFRQLVNVENRGNFSIVSFKYQIAMPVLPMILRASVLVMLGEAFADPSYFGFSFMSFGVPILLAWTLVPGPSAVPEHSYPWVKTFSLAFGQIPPLP
jgi:hypothetical protein